MPHLEDFFSCSRSLSSEGGVGSTGSDKCDLIGWFTGTLDVIPVYSTARSACRLFIYACACAMAYRFGACKLPFMRDLLKGNLWQ